MKVIERVEAFGHENVLSTHETTFEITKETHLTKRGDCIIAVRASKGARDFSSDFKEAARKKNAIITIIVEAGVMKDIIKAQGNPSLLFNHPTDMVIRKSDYICGRTAAVRANKAACELRKQLVEKLKNPNQKVTMTLRVDY